MACAGCVCKSPCPYVGCKYTLLQLQNSASPAAVPCVKSSVLNWFFVFVGADRGQQVGRW